MPSAWFILMRAGVSGFRRVWVVRGSVGMGGRGTCEDGSGAGPVRWDLVCVRAYAEDPNAPWGDEVYSPRARWTPKAVAERPGECDQYA